MPIFLNKTSVYQQMHILACIEIWRDVFKFLPGNKIRVYLESAYTGLHFKFGEICVNACVFFSLVWVIIIRLVLISYACDETCDDGVYLLY